MKTTREGQASRRDGFHYRYIQPRRAGTPTFGRGLCKRGGISKGDRQNNINDGNKWCGATPSPVECPQGIPKST